MLRFTVAAMLALSFATAPHAAGVADASAKMQFVKPVALRGTLGSDTIQMNLRTKAEFDDGIEGDYFLFGSSQKVLLAGEIEGEDLFLEESVNGTDVSGQWEGKMAGDVISGEWQSADGKISKPFQVRIVRPAGKSSKQ
ncbi:MAG TPA: hypothetical protein VEB70_00600 [Noviherbaspirillum sp.]|nr:hypothetical protein [Noviherbaspirillum sp.]